MPMVPISTPTIMAATKTRIDPSPFRVGDIVDCRRLESDSLRTRIQPHGATDRTSGVSSCRKVRIGASLVILLAMSSALPHTVYAQADSARRQRQPSVVTATYTVHGDTVRWIPDPVLFAKMRHPIDTLKFMFLGDSAVMFTPLGAKAVSSAVARNLRRDLQEVDYSKCLQKQLSAPASSKPDLNICGPLMPVPTRSGRISRSTFLQHGDTVRWIRVHDLSMSAGKSLGKSSEVVTDTTDFMFRGDSAVIIRPHGPRAVSPFFASVLRRLMESEKVTEQLHR